MVVGVLRADGKESESRWQCKVLTCAEGYHPLIECLQFLVMTPEERMDLVATASLCWGCLTPGHGAAVRTCPFREELRGLCAKRRCKQSHHQLLHMEGKPELHSYRHSRRSASEPVKPLVHIVAATARLSEPAAGSIGNTADKDSGRGALRNILGHGVSSDADNPQRRQRIGAEAHPGAAPQLDGRGEWAAVKILGAV